MNVVPFPVIFITWRLLVRAKLREIFVIFANPFIVILNLSINLALVIPLPVLVLMNNGSLAHDPSSELLSLVARGLQATHEVGRSLEESLCFLLSRKHWAVLASRSHAQLAWFHPAHKSIHLLVWDQRQVKRSEFSLATIRVLLASAIPIYFWDFHSREAWVGLPIVNIIAWRVVLRTENWCRFSLAVEVLLRLQGRRHKTWELIVLIMAVKVFIRLVKCNDLLVDQDSWAVRFSSL